MKICIAGVLVLLAGCVTATEVHLADGSKGHNISCHGAARNFSHCLQAAGEICGARGYEVVTQQGDAVPFAVQTYGPTAGQGFAGTAVSRNLFVRCK